MNKLFALVLAVSGSAASAQTPTTNPMPDGSRDMYAGLGVASAPRYEGADRDRVRALPVLQVQWNNGVFVSGMSAGMHLSRQPTVEYGPLLNLHARRSESGTGGVIGGVVEGASVPTLAPRPTQLYRATNNPLAGMDEIRMRPELGGFLNVYLTPEWRLTSSVLAGAGNDRNGVRAQVGIQRLALAVAPHHTVSLTAGFNFVNSAYKRSYFGVSPAEAQLTGHRVYRPDGGLKDMYAGVRWNWALSPSWMLTSSLQATHLTGDARRSPLVERPNNVTVSTAFAYRF